MAFPVFPLAALMDCQKLHYDQFAAAMREGKLNRISLLIVIRGKFSNFALYSLSLLNTLIAFQSQSCKKWIIISKYTWELNCIGGIELYLFAFCCQSMLSMVHIGEMRHLIFCNELRNPDHIQQEKNIKILSNPTEFADIN